LICANFIRLQLIGGTGFVFKIRVEFLTFFVGFAIETAEVGIVETMPRSGLMWNIAKQILFIVHVIPS